MARIADDVATEGTVLPVPLSDALSERYLAYALSTITARSLPDVRDGLSACAVTGAVEGLAYVSPRSGRAVSQEVAAPYAEKLLSLPSFLMRPEEDTAAAPAADIVTGLRLTGWFFEKHVFAGQGGRMPPARGRFIDRLQAGAAPP